MLTTNTISCSLPLTFSFLPHGAACAHLETDVYGSVGSRRPDIGPSVNTLRWSPDGTQSAGERHFKGLSAE